MILLGYRMEQRYVKAVVDQTRVDPDDYALSHAVLLRCVFLGQYPLSFFYDRFRALDL